MTITNYSELQAAIADFLNRDDLGATTQTFIALAEADISRRLRHWEMEARVSVSYDAQFEDVPADWVETISLYLTNATGPHQVDLISRAEMLDRRWRSADTAGMPKFYSMAGAQFELFPTPDDTYSGELLYTQKIPALSGAAPTNWLLTRAPDVYLYGALAHSAPYLSEDARAPVWVAAYENALVGLGRESKRAKYSGSGLRMKVRGLS